MSRATLLVSGPLLVLAGLIGTAHAEPADEAEHSEAVVFTTALLERMAQQGERVAERVDYFACRETYLHRRDLITVPRGYFLPGMELTFNRDEVVEAASQLSDEGLQIPDNHLIDAALVQTSIHWAGEIGEAQCLNILRAAIRPLCNHPDSGVDCEG